MSPHMKTMVVVSRIMLEFALVDDWKEILVEAGVINSLLVMINDPNKTPMGEYLPI